MQITFDTTNPSDLKLLAMLFNAQENIFAQPEVANTGTTATGSFNPLPPEGSGESGEAETSTASPAPVKKTRAKKEAPLVSESETKSEAVETVEAPATEAINLDDVRAALQQFTAARGVPAGIEVLKKFGAGRISELDETNYVAFVRECAL